MKAMLIILAPLLISGCATGDPSDPVAVSPGVATIVHGYETADGAVVKYSEVETGDDSGDGNGSSQDYSDRATAK